MNEMVYNVFHGMEWGRYIALYFYFTGLSAGTFIISSMATVMGMEKYKPLAKYGALLALLLLLVAPVLLIVDRSEEHTSELQSHSFISYAVFCLKKKT